MQLNVDLARENMIQNQIRTWEVLDPTVLNVLGVVQREHYVPAQHRALAFSDMQLPLGHGEVMMKPLIEGRMLQALAVAPTENVLEIGTGSGFITACLAHLAQSVVSIEQHADLAEAARARLAADRVDNVRIEVAEAVKSWKSSQRFDVVVVTGAVHSLPQHFRDWVAPGGRLFAIVGDSPVMQAILHRHVENAHWQESSLFDTDLPYLSNAAPPRRFVL